MAHRSGRAAAGQASGGAAGRSRWWPRWGLRPRILVWYVLLLTLASVVSVLVARQLLLRQLDTRIRDQLSQEVEELRVLAENGVDPTTGERFGGDIRRLFELFLERSIPSRNEALLTFVDGQPYLRSRQVMSYRLDQAPRLVDRWAQVESSTLGQVTTPAGEVDYQAVPIRLEGGTAGTFVVAIFREPEVAQLDRVVRTAGLAGLITVVVGSLLAWQVAERILEPVRTMTDTAREIGESDLSRRLEVAQDDELGDLARQLNDMLARLEAAFATHQRFVDEAGHELRTPLTAIRGHLEVMDDDPDSRRETIELVLDEIDRMARIVNDLLLLARSERPDFLVPETVPVDGLVRGIHAKAAGLADRDWGLADAPDLRMEADPQRLTQALLQLAQNAAEHTAPGDRIVVGADHAGGAVRLWVRDTGEGIEPDEQDVIFERFHRAGGGARRSEGAGLGLSIVRAIAQAHGGRVEVTSRPGEGSTFALVVPVASSVPEEES